MTKIWNHKNGIKAAFITRNDERNGYIVRSLGGLPTKSDEIQALESNRTVLSQYFEMPDISLSMGKQVHGTHIAITDQPEICDDTDGVITDKSGLAVAVLVADCAAVLLADRVNKIVAAVHAGWRGAVGGILPKAVDKMIKLGAEPDLIDGFVSPCISKSMFEVGEEVASRFPDRFVNRSHVKPHVDLSGFVRSDLVKCGINPESIHIDERCTMQHPDDLHSFRRDGQESGRMMAAIVVT